MPTGAGEEVGVRVPRSRSSWQLGERHRHRSIHSDDPQRHENKTNQRSGQRPPEAQFAAVISSHRITTDRRAERLTPKRQHNVKYNGARRAAMMTLLPRSRRVLGQPRS